MQVSPEVPAPVLLVRGLPDERAMYALALQSGGFSCIQAADDESAIELLRHTSPALVIDDVTVLNDQSLAFVRRLRQREEGGDVPVIVVSGGLIDLSEGRRAVVEAGGNLLLVKPCDPEMLLAETRRLIAWAAELRGRMDEQRARAEGLQRAAAALLERSTERLRQRSDR